MFDSKCNLFAENHLIFTQNVLLKAKKLEKRNYNTRRLLDWK